MDYDENERIRKLWTSEVKVPLYEFNYHDDHRSVTDARGGIQRFYYINRRLVKHEEPHRIHLFGWDTHGQLKNQILKDDKNVTFTEWKYNYDAKGNVKKADVMASIKESGSEDTYTVLYQYSEDGRNLIFESHPEGHSINYEYLPGTNILTKKLTWKGFGIVEREFYLYDLNGIRICTINDDGCQPNLDDLSLVTYRKFTEETPQLDANLPGMTLPMIIQEGYIDTFGNRQILKRVERTYCQGDLLAEEKIYDNQGNYCYSLKYDYNDRRELISETDSMGHQTIYQYDDNGNKIIEEKVGSGRKMVYGYDLANRLITELEYLQDGQIFKTTHAYDAMGNRRETTDIFGKTTKFQYDLASREIAVTDPLGYTIKKEYDVHGNVTRQIDQDGYATTSLYNLYGQPLEIHYPDGTEKRFRYNLHGHLVHEKERDGQTISYEVDYRGRTTIAHTHTPDGIHLKTIQKFYKGDNLILEIDALGNQISYTYDPYGRMIGKELGEKKTQFEYDCLGRLFKTMTSERVDIKEFDFLDRVTEERVEDRSGNVFQKICFAYDMNGNCISQKNYHNTDLFSETTTLYNARNLPVLLTDACGNQTSISYHYSDHLRKEIVDALGRKMLEIYNPLQRLKEVMRFSPIGILFAHHCLDYDRRGNETLRIDNILCVGQHLAYYINGKTYDSMGQKLSDTEQNKKTTHYKYHLGRLQEIIHPNGIVLSHAYDGLGRLARLTSSDSTIDYQYSYDANDNLLMVEDLISKTKVSRSYDIFNRQIYEKQTTGREISFDYDTLDRLKEVRFNENKISYDYNLTSLISAKRHQGSNLLYQYNQATDFRGKVLSCQLPNKSSVSYAWDHMGRCSSIDSPFFQQNMEYDAVGNLVNLSVNDPQGSYTANYTYDDANQLTSETGPFTNQYTCDSLHNRRNKNAFVNTINDLNQVAQDNNSQYTYDLNGRRLTKDNATYTYDALGRLTHFSNDQQSVHYVYDPFGRLMERSSLDGTTQYFYQFDTEIASFEDDQLKAFRPLHGIHAPFAIELDGIAYSPIRNHRGDICVLLDDEPKSSYRYNAFGEFVHQGGVDSPWLFSAQRYDTSTNLYHYAKREYDPVLGTWLTPDPLGFVDGPNLYTYVNNNPLTYVDPYGLWKEEYEKATRITRAVDKLGQDIRDTYRDAKAVRHDLEEFGNGFSRGFLDDASFGVSEFALGEVKFKSSLEKRGYEIGTGLSMAVGCLSGSTEIKGVFTFLKNPMRTSRAILNASKVIVKESSVYKVANKVKSVFKGTPQSALKTDVAKKSVQKVTSKGHDVIHVTPHGVAIPSDLKYQIPNHYVENIKRPGSFGEYINGKFVEKLRIDPATTSGMKGPNYSHYHLNGKNTHYSPRPGEPNPGFNP